ncbi:hypothetical protein A0256_10775 [Mucilaginibacter sp. PAMC 26640]|nr:hypothetical protein A0256_10775 [Mucilaginibacter sp. PAMC 26640]
MVSKLYPVKKYRDQLARGIFLVLFFLLILLFIIPLLFLLLFNFKIKPVSFTLVRQNSQAPQLSRLGLKI